MKRQIGERYEHEQGISERRRKKNETNSRAKRKREGRGSDG